MNSRLGQPEFLAKERKGDFPVPQRREKEFASW
jgi:hypothetical protein